MRNPIYVLKSLEEKAKDPEYRYERLYRNLYNPKFFQLAYGNIAKSTGSMTPGSDGKTLNGMSEARIQRIINSLKDHSYHPNPARREYIAKKNNPAKKRPLGIPSTDDKLVQEVVRMLLEAIYEPTFSKHSHGFRPNRSCHTALEDIQFNFKGSRWIVEGDIHACFDSFDHHVLIDLLRKRIKDEAFLSLMWKLLKAGHMEQWVKHVTYSGTPQGSGVSPILANIYLTEIDRFVENLKSEFDKKDLQPKSSRQYSKARYQMQKAKLAMETDRNSRTRKVFKSAQQAMLKTLYQSPFNANHKKLVYCRYADDFVIGIIGSKEDATKVKEKLKLFLSDILKITLSEEKTHITHSSELIRFLGYDFTVSRSKDIKRGSNGTIQRFRYGKVRLYVPREKWIEKLREYQAVKICKDADGKERWKAVHRGKFVNYPEAETISKYNAEIRGIYNYYRMAVNVSVLNKFYFIMENSLFKTLACKHKSSVRKIREKYTENDVFGAWYESKSGRKRCELYHDGFPMKKGRRDDSVDTLPTYRKYDKPNSLANRLIDGMCEKCSNRSEDIHMYHVKTMKELTGKNEFEALMLKRRRKTLALCNECFNEIQQINSSK